MRPVPGSPGALGIVSRFRFAGGAETGSGREIALPGWHATRVSSLEQARSQSARGPIHETITLDS